MSSWHRPLKPCKAVVIRLAPRPCRPANRRADRRLAQLVQRAQSAVLRAIGAGARGRIAARSTRRRLLSPCQDRRQEYSCGATGRPAYLTVDPIEVGCAGGAGMNGE